MFKIRKFIHVSYSKNRDWKPVISQILTNVQEIFLVMWMLTVPTPLDHMYVHATLDTLEMDKLAQVILIGFLQSQLFEAESNLERPFNSNYGARSSITFILKWSPTWFTPHQKWCIIWFCPTSFENSFAVFCVVILYVLMHQNIFIITYNYGLWRGALDPHQTSTSVRKWTSVMSTPPAVIPRAPTVVPVILNTLGMVWLVKVSLF